MRKGSVEENKKIIILCGVILLLLILIVCVILSIKERKEDASVSALPVVGMEESVGDNSAENDVDNGKDAEVQTEGTDAVESTTEDAGKGMNTKKDGVIELPFVPAN